MSDFHQISAKIKHYKCFGEEEQGFDCIKPMNLIIGRNNSGKSSLLDLIKFLTDKKPKFQDIEFHQNHPPEIILKTPCTEKDLKRVFQENTSGGEIGMNHWDFGKQYVGRTLNWQYPSSHSAPKFLSLDGTSPNKIRNQEAIEQAFFPKLVGGNESPLKGRVFKRIFPERDITPENDDGNCDVLGNGQKVTTIIHHFINKAWLPSELVEKTLLVELNKIFGPDGKFTDIVCQQLGDGRWEVSLQEELKGRIPLSLSGSGLKTIIIILVFLYLVPKIENSSLENYVFGIEEPENNMHPALLRNLLQYLFEKCQENGCIFFITTHSNVAIDQFSRSSDAQTLHVTHDKKNAICQTVKTYIDNKGILDDLDVRASDLLQSNCVIWVEGPSDRIYFNRWVEIWSEGKIREGTQYQCVFYGGRLLSHLSLENPDEVKEAISILNVNRNAIILMDSDQRSSDSPINSTKRRILEEVQENGGIAWLTECREIENYIPADAVGKILDLSEVPKHVGPYEDFFDYLDDLSVDAGKKHKDKKPVLAEKICPHLTKENLNDLLDLNLKMGEICLAINKWNS